MKVYLATTHGLNLGVIKDIVSGRLLMNTDKLELRNCDPFGNDKKFEGSYCLKQFFFLFLWWWVGRKEVKERMPELICGINGMILSSRVSAL